MPGFLGTCLFSAPDVSPSPPRPGSIPTGGGWGWGATREAVASPCSNTGKSAIFDKQAPFETDTEMLLKRSAALTICGSFPN